MQVFDNVALVGVVLGGDVGLEEPRCQAALATWAVNHFPCPPGPEGVNHLHLARLCCHGRLGPPR